MTAWTDERVDQLRALWAEGPSATAIARAMGGDVTRNAVIGKVHRLGLTKRRKPPSLLEVRQRVERRAAAKARPPLRRLARPHVASPSTALVVLPLPAATPTLDGSGKVRFRDRDSYQCSWIDADPLAVRPDDLMCCGLPVARREEHDPEWCGAHQRIGHSRGTPSERAAA